MTIMRAVGVHMAAAAVLLSSAVGLLGSDGVAFADTGHVATRHVEARPALVATGPDGSPNCGRGVRLRKIVAKYKAKRHQTAGYRADILYCGNSKYGFRHLEPHIGQYFGGWGNFSFSIAQVLKRPANWVMQKNGNFLESAPIFQCFFQGFYIIWTFYVVPQIKSGTIVTAYGREGRRTNQPCP